MVIILVFPGRKIPTKILPIISYFDQGRLLCSAIYKIKVVELNSIQELYTMYKGPCKPRNALWTTLDKFVYTLFGRDCSHSNQLISSNLTNEKKDDLYHLSFFHQPKSRSFKTKMQITQFFVSFFLYDSSNKEIFWSPCLDLLHYPQHTEHPLHLIPGIFSYCWFSFLRG